jgi:hypothetical protein
VRPSPPALRLGALASASAAGAASASAAEAASAAGASPAASAFVALAPPASAAAPSFAPFLAGAFFAGAFLVAVLAGALAPLPNAFAASSSSTLEAATLTSRPALRRTSSASLLVTPCSFAISWTRFFANS